MIKNSVPSGSAGLPRNQALDIAKGKLIGFVDMTIGLGPHIFKSLLKLWKRIMPMLSSQLDL